MKVQRPSHCSVHQNWRSDDASTLTVTVAAGCVQLAHTAASYEGAEATTLQLSAVEAGDLAERIKMVAPGENADNGDYEGDEPSLVVTATTDGEPFREGVSLALNAGDWNRDFSFEMTREAAAQLARSLSTAAALCGETKAAEVGSQAQHSLDNMKAVAWQSRFIVDGDEGWAPCSLEHHEMVRARPSAWKGYETRELYLPAAH